MVEGHTRTLEKRVCISCLRSRETTEKNIPVIRVVLSTEGVLDNGGFYKVEIYSSSTSNLEMVPLNPIFC